MPNISQNPNGTYKVVLYLNEDEKRRLKKLARKLELNDFETIKYCLQLVAWWSKNEIEPEEAE